MKSYFAVLLVFIFAILAAPGAVRADTSDRFSMGGRYGDFAPAVGQANASGEMFRIRGHCQSNCTLFLGVRNVCVERNSELLFHAGHFLGPDRDKINPVATQRMLAAYNPKLRQYVVAHGYLDKLSFSTISGARIIDEFGYRECPKR